MQRSRGESLLHWIKRAADDIKMIAEGPYVIETPFLGQGAKTLLDAAGFLYGLAMLLGPEDIFMVSPTQAKASMGRKKPKGVPYKDRKNYIVQAVMEDTDYVVFLAQESKARREAICDAIAIARAGCLLYGDGNKRFACTLLAKQVGVRRPATG